MKKILAMAVLALFILSIIPVSLADNERGKDNRDGSNANNEDKEVKLERAGSKVVLKEIRGKAEERFEILKGKREYAKFKEELELKARKIAKERMEQLREDYAEAKKHYTENKRKYQEGKDQFLSLRQEFAACTGNVTECSELEDALQESAKEYLLKIADHILDYLEKVKNRIEANEDLSDEEAAELLAEVDAQIQAVTDAKAAVEAATTKEELQDAAQALKQAWKDIKPQADSAVGKVVNARIGGIIVKSRQLEVKLDKILARMETAGTNTTSAQILVDEFNQLITEAGEHYELAIAAFNEARTGTRIDQQKLREGHNHLKEAQKSLQAAQKKLRDIILSIKQHGGTIFVDNDTNETADNDTVEINDTIDINDTDDINDTLDINDTVEINDTDDDNETIEINDTDDDINDTDEEEDDE